MEFLSARSGFVLERVRESQMRFNPHFSQTSISFYDHPERDPAKIKAIIWIRLLRGQEVNQ